MATPTTIRYCWEPSFFGRHWSPDPNLDNKSGSAWFGIDAKYLINVQKKEIFDLVAEGWNSETLYKMSIEERRFYYHKLIEKYSKDKNNAPPSAAEIQKKSQKK